MNGAVDMRGSIGMGADRVGGWQNHFRRMERWQERATTALGDLPQTEFHDALDFALAYFVWAHSLREWLVKDEVVKAKRLKGLLERETTWPMVKDLANRSRHFKITRDPTDRDWTVRREFDYFAIRLEGRERHHVNLYFGGEKHRLIDVVASTGKMWGRVLQAVELDVDSFSA